MNDLNNPEIKTHETQFTPSKFPNFTNHATKNNSKFQHLKKNQKIKRKKKESYLARK
jgi:hypothetical protein